MIIERKRIDTLVKFLDKKTLYYDKIDYDVIAKSWSILKNYIKLPFVIHIIGTNGKGSTGRFLASFLNQQNKTVLHYSSPHILKFNERIWINGEDISDNKLNQAHSKLQEILPITLIKKLTYFEYTTLIALLLSSNMDYLVLEAGLGGEFDATNVVKNDFTVIPSIGLDHQDFLGDTIEEIATTKMRSCDNSFILGLDISQKVLDVKDDILKNKNEIFIDKNIELSDKHKQLPKYLQNNLLLSLRVLRYLDFKDFNYKLPLLFGRFQKITQNITIDVGHNPLAAKVILQELKQNNKKIILVYNSYKDKDYTSVLNILKPIIKEVQIINCKDDRMVQKDILVEILNNLSINIKTFDIMNLSIENDYLIFGSFIVVEEFLKGYRKI
ncbi:MAG: bifunctional folylpolyglutamate synthase/dihydrofolate synthase [Epsilonproteobacteria bacterium]|nr:MAG: bifunctional folylpolyglutamate synthase/dihydrofolate synthase [Campylobacterota bacterium]